MAHHDPAMLNIEVDEQYDILQSVRNNKKIQILHILAEDSLEYVRNTNHFIIEGDIP